MRSPSEMVLQSFLSRCSPEKRKRLAHFLPEEERERLEKTIPLAHEISAEEFTNHAILEHVHWSWFIPTLKSYTPKEQKLFLVALSPTTAASLGNALDLNPPFPEITETARAYLRQILQTSLVTAKDRLLPLPYLPPSPLNALLSMSKKELTHLIDLLSLFDLAGELRQIVETKILKKIYSFLNDEERRYLKQVSSHKDPLSTPRLNLERWDGTEDSLRLMLHRRGLNRLAVALSGQDPDLVWYVCHQLDIGRGNTLFHSLSKEAPLALTDGVVKQIEELIRGL